MAKSNTRPALVVGSLVVAAILTVIPLPDALTWWRPYWMALVVIYWRLESPDAIGLGRAFLIGLFTDLLTGTLVGQHALSLVIIAFIIGRFRLRLRFFPIWQQALVILAILVNDRIIYALINALAGATPPQPALVIAPLIATVLWPLVFVWLDASRRRLRR